MPPRRTVRSPAACVPPSAIGLTDFLYFLNGPSEEAIHDGGLPYSGGAEQHHGLPRSEVFFQFVESLACFRAYRAYGDAHGDAFHLFDFFLARFADIGFIQNNHGLRAGFPALREISFDAPRIEVAVEAGNNQRYIHIRGDDLLRELLPCHLANKTAAARKYFVYLSTGSLAAEFHGHPVADRGPFCALFRSKTQLSRSFGRTLAEVADHAPKSTALRNHTRRDGVRALRFFPNGLKMIIPTPTKN